MKPIVDFEKINFNNFEQIELGGHYCKVLKVEERVSKNGNNMLVVAFDFSEDDKQRKYFTKLFDENKKSNENAKYPNNGILYFNVSNEVGQRIFKSFINSILAFNVGYEWSWNEQTLINKKFGGVFGREEYLNNNGEIRSIVKCRYFVDYTNVEECDIPTDKKIDSSKIQSIDRTFEKATSNSFDLINDDDLPF